MRITKIGHCCLIIEEAGLKILTDPGQFTGAQNEVRDVNVVLITHEHADHLHVESLKAVLRNNPQAKIYTNKGVGKILDGQNIPYELLEDGQSTVINKITIEGLGQEHAQIYETVPAVMNTGYFINGKLFYPGDALTDPRRPVEILALPVAGPWLKISESIDYAKLVKPKKVFPVHDGMIKQDSKLNYFRPYHLQPQIALGKAGIDFTVLTDGESFETDGESFEC